MKKLLTILGIPVILVLGWMVYLNLSPDSAWAQCTGVFPANTLCGNTTGSPQPPAAVSTPVVTSSQFDIAFCSTVGSIIARYTGQWLCSRNIPINVMWFGAKGDGSTDDTAAIKSAINVIAPFTGGNGATPGGELYFPCGVYISGTLSVQFGQVISGGGPDCSILKWKASSVSTFITTDTTLAGSVTVQGTETFRNLSIDGNASNQGAGNQYCLHIQNVQLVVVDNVKITNCYLTAILVNDAASQQQFSSGMLMTNSHITQWGKSGTGNAVDVEQFNFYVGIVNSQLDTGPSGSGAGQAALYVNGTGNPVVVTGSNIFTNAPDIFLQNSLTTQIMGSQIGTLGSNSVGVELTGNTKAQIIGNYFGAFTNKSIAILNSSNRNVICNNIIDEQSVQTSLAVQEDTTSKPNLYCGETPATTNQFSTAGFSSGNRYSINGPTPGPGTASIAGCTAGVCTQSTDWVGSLITSTNITSATINFGSNWTIGPACTISSSVTSPQAALSSATSASMTVLFSAALSSATVAYICNGTR